MAGETRRILGKILPKRLKKLIGPRANPPVVFEYKLAISHRGRLDGLAVIVTGGGGSIGSAISYRLALEGANVGVAGRRRETLEATIQQIERAGVEQGRATPLVMDVTSPASVEAGIHEFTERHGKLDVLINNAGASARGKVFPLAQQSLSVIDDIIQLNLMGPLICCKLAIPHLIKTKGRIINFGSVIGLHGQKNYSEYAAAKAGIVGLSKSLALELGQHGIAVNVITPGWVWRNPFDGNTLRLTEGTALGRHGYPEEVAGLVAYLCSEEAGYITGHDFVVDGGRSLGLRDG